MRGMPRATVVGRREGAASVNEETPGPAETAERPPILIGTGMPATTLLEAFGQWLYDAFGETAYHVGSSTHGKSWRDVDVRLMLDDDEFHALFPGYKAASQRDAKWALLCAAISELGKRQTGLPIDFQLQSASGANENHRGFRNPLWLYNHSSVEAAKKREAEKPERGEQ